MAGVSSGQSYGSAARRIVQAALKEVRHWLPLAAERQCSDDGENVHRLRVATRRANVALSAFQDLLDLDEAEALREELRQIRKAADAARNVDATLEHFLAHGAAATEELRAKLRERLALARQEAQVPIVAMHRKMSDAQFDDRIKLLLSDIETRHPKRAAQTFGKRARSVLKPALRKFFRASKADISDDVGLHYLRIQAKKLRYTMEIVAVAFRPSFSGKLYQRFCEFQDVMGAIRDRVIMAELLRGWLAMPCDEPERVFLDGLLHAEKTAHAEWMQTFKAMWTKNYVQKLKRDFDEHMREA